MLCGANSLDLFNEFKYINYSLMAVFWQYNGSRKTILII